MKAKFPDELLTQIAVNTIDRTKVSKSFLKSSNSALSESIDENETFLNEFKLYQNYPNPFNSITKIPFNLHKKDIVTIKIYDLLGKRNKNFDKWRIRTRLL